MGSPKTEKKSVRAMFSEIPRKAKWLIYLTSFSAVGFGYFFIAVSAYYTELNISPSSIGLILGSSGAASVLTAIPMGIYADKRGRKLPFLLGLFGIPPMLIVFAFTTDVLFLVVAAVGAGVAEGAFMASWNALIADMTSAKTRTAAFSLSFIVGSGTSAFGFVLPLFFPLIEDFTGASSHTVHSGFFIIVALLALVSPIALSFLLRGYKEIVKPGAKLIRGKNLGTVLRFSGCNSLIGLGAGFIIPLIPTWLWLKFGVPDSSSGPLLAVANVLMAFSAIASTALAFRYGSVKAIVLTESLATVFMVSLAYIPGAALAGLLYLIRAALMNMSSPISDSYLMGIILPEERGLASSINAIVWRLPNSVSTVVGGVILASGNFELPFLLAAAFYAASISLFYALFRNVKPIS